MSYQSIKVSIDDLLLDVDNPRFIIPQGAKQNDLIKYLTGYEEAAQLANGINKSGGLSAGERIIITRNGEKYVVLEGNRRVCACKILLDRQLIPEGITVANIDSETKKNIMFLDADLVESRESVQNVLYRRHINGVKDWSPISKLKFSAAEFDNNMTIEDIATLTSAKPGDVRRDLRNYKLVMYALSLPEWGKHHLSTPDIYQIKITYFTHALETTWDGISEKTGFSLLKLVCDDSTKYKVISPLPQDIFTHAIFLIVKAAFLDKILNTRKHIGDIPEIVDYLTKHGIIDTEVNTHLSIESESTNPLSSQTTQNIHINGADTIRGNSANSNSNIDKTNEEEREQANISKEVSGNVKASSFFENLTWGALNPALPEQNGLVALANELKTISLKKYYSSCPIATAMLVRALFEQSLKYYLQKKNEWANLLSFIDNKSKQPKPKGYDPMLNEVISFLRSKNKYQAVFAERTIQSAFTNATTQEMLDFLNTNIHNTHILRATRQDLESRAVSGGLFSLINYILNDK
jgi:uncharacterized protein (UPF0332 family)